MKYSKLLDYMIVTGYYKILFYKKKFEIEIYFTPHRGTIIDIKTKLKKIPFKEADNIQLVRDWVELNNFNIKIEINRI